MKNKKTWCVANRHGHLIAHDVSEATARCIASDAQKREPEEEWETIDAETED